MEGDSVVVSQEQTPPRFSREQKVGYAVVIGCGLLAVLFGGFYLFKHLHSPFVITYTGNRLLTGDDATAAAIAAEKAKDTDSDGVNDYDEFNIYGTSAYIADSDDDGVNDGAEISAGTDPACAPGETCERGNEDIEGASGLGAEAEAEAAAAAAQYEALKASLRNLSTEEIRTLLIDSGAEEAKINAMTDDEVRALYDQVLTDLESSGGLDALISQAAGAAASTEAENSTTTP